MRRQCRDDVAVCLASVWQKLFDFGLHSELVEEDSLTLLLQLLDHRFVTEVLQQPALHPYGPTWLQEAVGMDMDRGCYDDYCLLSPLPAVEGHASTVDLTDEKEARLQTLKLERRFKFLASRAAQTASQ